jgi:DNA-binding CsgD family transcriptional regulator
MQALKSNSSREVNSAFLRSYPLDHPGEREKPRRMVMLTNRERNVLALAGRGLTNQGIAEELGISSRTVKCILHHACLKMRAHNRTQALFTAINKGYINIREVLSLNELIELYASLDSEAKDSVSQCLKLKDERDSFISGRECVPHPENKRLAVAASSSAYST